MTRTKNKTDAKRAMPHQTLRAWVQRLPLFALLQEKRPKLRRDALQRALHPRLEGHPGCTWVARPRKPQPQQNERLCQTMIRIYLIHAYIRRHVGTRHSKPTGTPRELQ